MLKTAFIICLTAVFFCAQIFAQAPVVENRLIESQLESEQMNETKRLVLEIQALKEEISFLRGQVEDFEYRVQSMEKQQKDNYIDLDSRLMQLSAKDTSSDRSTVVIEAQSEESSSDVLVNLSDSEESIDPAANTELSPQATAAFLAKNLYDEAFMALRSGDRVTTIERFEELLERFPEANKADDARYWLGETYWLNNQPDKSLAVFTALLENFPNHRKMGDVKYRLGAIYGGMGDKEKAFDFMSEVLFSGSSQSAAAQAWIIQNTEIEKAVEFAVTDSTLVEEDMVSDGEQNTSESNSQLIEE